MVPSTLVIIPTLNEAENIDPLLERLRVSVPKGTDLLFIDDNSRDETVLRIRAWQTDNRFPGEIALLQRPRKMGLGTAYVTGFAWGLSRPYNCIMTMDADGSHPAETVPKLVAELERADVAIGSRYVPGGGTRNWGLFRRILSRAGGAYARWVLGVNIRDFTAGMMAYRRDVLEKLNLRDITSEGYGFNIEMKYRAVIAGSKLVEVPIIFVERTFGASKMSFKIIIEAVGVVWKLGARLPLSKTHSAMP